MSCIIIHNVLDFTDDDGGFAKTLMVTKRSRLATLGAAEAEGSKEKHISFCSFDYFRTGNQHWL